MDNIEISAKTRLFTVRAFFLFILLIAAFAGYIHYIAPQKAGNQQIYDNLAVFGVRLQNLENTATLHEKRIADLESRPAGAAAALIPPQAPVPAANFSNKDDEDRITALEKQVMTLTQNTSAAAFSEEHALQAIHLLSTYHRLTDKLLTGRPYTAESADYQHAMESMGAPAPQALSQIAPYAENGMPTFAQLLVSFDEANDQLGIFEATPPAGAGLWERFIFNLKHLIRIRKMEEGQSGNTPDAIVGRAQAHLEREEVEEAIAEITSLPADARSNFTNWLEDAQAYAMLGTRVDQLEDVTMQTAFRTKSTAKEQPEKP